MPCKRALCKYRAYKRNWIDNEIPVCEHPKRHTLTWTPWARLWRLIFGQDHTCYADGETDCRLYEHFAPAPPPEQPVKERPTIIEQARILRDKCPDIWNEFIDGCPSGMGLKDKIDCTYHEDCDKCWRLALEDGD